VLVSLKIIEKEREKEREKKREKEKEFEVYLDYDAQGTLTRTRKPSAAVRPSAAEKRGYGYNTTRPRAQQAKRSGEGTFLRLQCNTTHHEARNRAT
jgi:hypothetical protein